MTVDLLGKAVTEIRDNAAVAAITPRVRGGELFDDDAPPAVVIRGLSNNFSPFGRTRRARLQSPTLVALCYGLDRQKADELANAVTSAVNLKGPRRDASGRLVHLSLVDSHGPTDLDPATRWPLRTVLFRMIGAQDAIA